MRWQATQHVIGVFRSVPDFFQNQRGRSVKIDRKRRTVCFTIEQPGARVQKSRVTWLQHQVVVLQMLAKRRWPAQHLAVAYSMLQLQQTSF